MQVLIWRLLIGDLLIQFVFELLPEDVEIVTADSSEDSQELLTAVQQTNTLLAEQNVQLVKLNDGMTFFCGVFITVVVVKAVWHFLTDVAFGGIV